MPDRIALKRLTASDLTFFESLFRTVDAGNQKAINLNADVFVEQFYPSLPALASTVQVKLTILGPAGATPYAMSRAITKRDAYKNWRLNGEFIRDPDGEAGRFNILKAGDLAVLEFEGDPTPQSATLLLVAAATPTDAPLHAALNTLVPGGRKTMVEVTRAKIAEVASTVPPTHPIWSMAADPQFSAALEDAAQAGVRGVHALSRKTARPVSAAALAAAKVVAENNGRDGEARKRLPRTAASSA